jgi:2-polyprenyl-3-methyl-5-hydroxy-6-metoxy-1,4-benzoquinol methylase
VSPDGTAVAVDLDLSLVHVRRPNLKLRKADIVASPAELGAFDLVTARAVLHHVSDAQAPIANIIACLKAGRAILLIEPDLLPVSVAKPQRCVRFGTAGLHGRVNGESIISFGEHLRLDWLRSA